MLRLRPKSLSVRTCDALLVAARILVADSIMPTDFIKNFRGEMIPRKLILERSAEFSVHIQKLDEELR